MTKSRCACAAILCLVWSFSLAPSGFAARAADSPDTLGVLRGLSIASFAGTSKDSIQAVVTDSSGNIFVAGTTSSPNFPVKNAAQPAFGDSAILRTTDLGATWSRVGYPANVTVIVPDPVNSQALFAGGSNGIYKSTDAGQTWRVVYPLQVGYSTSFPMVIDRGNHLRLAAIIPVTGVFIRSLDGGETWTPGGLCNSSPCSGQLVSDPSGSGALLLNGFGLSISRDWGLTFQPLAPPGQGTTTASAFDPSHPGWIYASNSRGAAIGSLSLSTDYGATWTPKSPPPSVFGIMTLAVDPSQPNTLVAATATALYKSSDGAASWTLQAGPSGPQPGPSFMPDTNYPFVMVPHSCSPSGGLFAVGPGAVAFSPDFGLTWTTPQFTSVTSVASGPACTFYVTRLTSSDAFVAKVAPEGGILWATYLGGSDRDAPVALALDAQGNVYVAGNTSSPDFPTSAPHIGPQGENSIFLTKFSSNGQLIYSTTIGGESTSSAVALAIDVSQNAYIAGTTLSMKFPVTSGVIVSNLDLGSYTGFLVKLLADGTLSYGTYLGESYTYPGAILVDANEEAIIGGWGPVPGFPLPAGGGSSFVMKLDRTASQIFSVSYLPGVQSNSITGLATDAQSNLVVFGGAAVGTFQATAGAYASPRPASSCSLFGGIYAGDAFVMKLRASDWQPIYGALFTSACGIQTGAVAIDSRGSAVLAMGAGAGLALRSPLLAGPVCPGDFTSAIAKLSPDGSTLQFSTYLDNCGITAIALAGDGSIYTGVSPAAGSDATSVLHLTNPNPAPISLDQISNAFSGDGSVVAGGGLYTLATSGFSPSAINLGLNPTEDLPPQLGGVAVRFNGVSATILATAPGRVMVAAPPGLPILPDARAGAARKGPNNATVFTSVQLFYNGVASNVLWMPVAKSLPGLLTLDYPNLVYHAQSADGIVHNQDGTQNSVNNPAASGSTITLFATGMGATNPQVAPGAIAHSTVVTPIAPVYSSWETGGPGVPVASETVTSIPGFVSSMFQVQIQVPASNRGTDEGNGVQRVVVGLLFSIEEEVAIFPVSNSVGVYVK